MVVAPLGKRVPRKGLQVQVLLAAPVAGSLPDDLSGYRLTSERMKMLAENGSVGVWEGTV